MLIDLNYQQEDHCGKEMRKFYDHQKITKSSLVRFYLHHLHKIFFLHKSLLKFVFFCPELNWVGIRTAKML